MKPNPFALFAFTVAIGLPSMLYSAQVAVILWGWFIEPFGVQYLDLAWAVGFGCAIWYYCPKPKYDPNEESSYLIVATKMIRFCLATSFLLLIGWSVHLFM